MATKIIRDTDGIAHIRAGDSEGAFRGQGFAAAQDRLWQMEFDRRKALGRLAEIVGPGAVGADAYHLRLGIARAARADFDRLSSPTVAVFEAYARGVDEAVAAMDHLPPEFGLLEAPAPAPWEPWHCIAVFKVRHLWMGTAEVKLWRSAVASVVGPTMAARLWPSLPGVHVDPDVIAGVATMGLDTAVAETARTLADLERLGSGSAASNNFVIAGSRTDTGLPIMAGDPHRAIDLPNVYWQNHLTWGSAADDGVDVIGLSFPGVPGFPHFGHNADVAWSITHGMADDQDLFLERFDDRDPVTDRRSETIPVAGEADRTIECLTTANGPIVAGGPDAGMGIALRWTATAAPDTTYDCLVPQMSARSTADLDRAFERWVVPCNNVLIADRSGTIAYRFRGRLALRPEANGWTIVDGSDPTTAWSGFVDDSDLARIRDPERGFLVTANNPIGDGVYVSHDWAHPARANRLTDLLTDDVVWTVDAATAVLGDTHSAVASRFARRISDLSVQSPPERRAQAALADWDHHMDASSAAAVVYATTRAELVRLVSERLRIHQAPEVDGMGYTLGQAVRALHVRTGFLIDDDDVVTDDLLGSAFRSAVHSLVQHFGGDLSTWRWGALHTAGFHHPLAALRPDLAPRLARPAAVELGGDNECIWAAGTVPPSLQSVTSPVARYVFDLADWDRSAWNVPHGVHGDPGHPHHDDQLARWAAVELSPMRYSTATVDAATVDVIDLPADGVVMKGITVPERTEDFTADPVELFFDLAFVYAFSQLVGHLVHHPDWVGVGQAALLFALLWLPWSQFTWSANAVSGNGRRVRALFLGATAISVPMAASVSTAFDDGGPVFAVCLGCITLIGMATMALGDAMSDSERSSIAQWVSINAVALVLLVAGSFLDGGARTAAWIASMTIVFIAMAWAGRGDWVIRPSHFSERHGLITIIALGEVIVAIGVSVVATLEGGEGIPPRTLVSLAASGIFVALLWWAYFDRPARALEHRAASLEGRDLSRFVRDVYTWCHLLIVAGIVLAAAGLEAITLHPADPVPPAFRAMLVGGLCLSVAGITAAIWRSFRVLPKERLAAGAVLTVVAATAGGLRGVIVIVVFDLVLLATLVVEHRRIEH